MQDTEHAERSSVPSLVLPWIVAVFAFVAYLFTMSHWVTLSSLPLVAKVTGWDWSLPQTAPLLYLLTLPVKWLPASAQPLAMNVFSAACAALTLGLLARSVMLLPHDRTHEQRQRERSEFSLLSIRAWWLPPIFAALVCGLQRTFWEHSASATGESLNILLFAYVIRCLLEARIDPRDSWLCKFAFVYGLGMVNDWAFIGFFPLFLAAVIWIRGFAFFKFETLSRMALFGALGLMLYLLLPALWVASGTTDLSFFAMLKAYLGAQKAFLLDFPALRSRALVLSLTSILPVIIIGIRWPTTFGDTSAAGSALTNIMFRVIHLLFLVACASVVFDLKYSPRSLGFGLPFLGFYYLGALCIGYFSGYVLLVFGESRPGKTWRRSSSAGRLAGKLVAACVWAAAAVIAGALAWKNFSPVRAQNGPLLKEFAAAVSSSLPERGAVVLSDDPTALMLVSGYVKEKFPGAPHMLLHTRSMLRPDYHRMMLKRYPGQWPNVLTNAVAAERVDDASILNIIRGLQQTKDVYYLHPSFGYYFEVFYPEIKGLSYRLAPYSAEEMFPPAPAPADLQAGEKSLSDLAATAEKLKPLRAEESPDARFLSTFYSRAANFYGTALQRNDRAGDAGKWFQFAKDLNSNNIPAQVNLEINKALLNGGVDAATQKRTEDQFLGSYRNWETLISENGPFDHPEVTFTLGKTFLARGLARQAAIELTRTQALVPDNAGARLAMVDFYLQTGAPARAMTEIQKIRSSPLGPSVGLELVRLEASAYFAQTNEVAAERILLEAHAAHPRDLGVLDTLMQSQIASGKLKEALATCDKMLAIAPASADILLTKANVQQAMQAPDQAIATLDEILKRNSSHVGALLYKGFIHIQAKDYPKARAVIERALDVDPRSVEALTYAAVIELEEKKYDKAVEFLDRALKQDPGNWTALRNRALTHLRRGALGDAKADYEALQRKEPYYHGAYYGLGEIAYQRKDTQTAIHNYELYLRYAPQAAGTELTEERSRVEARLNELKGGQR